MNINYRKFEDADRTMVVSMIQDFYNVDPSGKSKTEEQIYKTFEAFEKHPDYGLITIFNDGNKIVGYCVIVNFYSNEYGGLILNIDELYIIPEYRGKGISTDYVKYLKERKDIEFVAMELEVLPYNARALKLYEKLGFMKSDRSYLMLKKDNI
ncbi:MAG: GNAT family N-acetyltransferase [Sporocytophaga sp.]|nr:GNAT family N-acetyltransferase [Sporocytophaga sp.]